LPINYVMYALCHHIGKEIGLLFNYSSKQGGNLLTLSMSGRNNPPFHSKVLVGVVGVDGSVELSCRTFPPM
jgi:hypothetical protein